MRTLRRGIAESLGSGFPPFPYRHRCWTDRSPINPTLDCPILDHGPEASSGCGVPEHHAMSSVGPAGDPYIRRPHPSWTPRLGS